MKFMIRNVPSITNRWFSRLMEALKRQNIKVTHKDMTEKVKAMNEMLFLIPYTYTKCDSTLVFQWGDTFVLHFRSKLMHIAYLMLSKSSLG